MRKTITTQTVYGLGKAQATARKWLAVNRCDDDYWGVTHIPSGLLLPGHFVSKSDAIAASKIARSFFPHPLRQNNQTLIPTADLWFDELKNEAIPFIK
jgi:hypothetical protein